MPWIRQVTAIVTALAALAALATAPEVAKESLGPAAAGDAWEEERGAEPTEHGQKVERGERSGPSERVERGERSGSGNSGRH